MYRKTVFISVIIIISLTVNVLHSQSLSNLRFKTQTVDSLIINLDSLTIVPESFLLSGLDTSAYKIDFSAAKIFISDSAAIGKLITYSYRVFTIDFSKKSNRKSTDIILNRMIPNSSANQIQLLGEPLNELLFDSSLDGTGSISRSLSLGNNQNFVLDAHLNLQLSGFLAPDIEILANITDENLPVQPEGNTRVIKDFNKIFIQLKYKNLLTLKAGDIEIPKPKNDYFLRVNRQFLGVEMAVHSQIDSINYVHNVIGGGITKGKYTRNNIAPIHGVQGPYKLHGEQNETAIVIIAGSERVFIDGVPLLRGQDNDYIIDYNTGEITFSTKILITSEKRISVTFEYSDRYYSRYNLFTYNEFYHEKNNKLKLNVNFIHEQDIKNQSIQPELDDGQKLFLSHLGDNLTAASYPTAILSTDNSLNEILYIKKDTLVNGEIYHSIYEYVSSGDTLYRVTFSYLGANKGNYKLSQTAVNGKVYRWVAPVNGVPQGEYEPTIFLNTPKMRDIATVAATYHWNDKLLIQTELAFSYVDNNLFSSKNDADNAGWAYQLQTSYKTPLRKQKEWSFYSMLNYEYVNQNFSPFQSFRAIEFGREYNLTTDYAVRAPEQIMEFKTGFTHASSGESYYALNWLLRKNQVNAIRNELTSIHQWSDWQWNTTNSFLFSTDDIQKTNFLKSYNDFSKSFSKIKIGLKDNLEYNIYVEKLSDSLRANSYAFNEAALYLKNSDSMRNSYWVQLKNRIDNALYNNVLSVNAIAYEGQVGFDFNQWKHNRLKGTATYRYDNVRDSLRNFYGEQTFVGSIDYSGNFWKGAVTVSLYYEAGSGLEQKKNYSFLKVATGQGSYIWNDYNHNGIEELNEFEVAAFQSEADYIKVWLTTNEYVTTYNNGLTQTLQLRPANVWRNQKGFRKILAMFSNTTTLRTYQKNTLARDLRAFNPFQFNLADSVLVNNSLNFKNNFSFNPFSNYFTLDWMLLKNQTKNLMYYGFENAILDMQQIDLQSSPTKMIKLKTSYSHSLRKNDSQYFDNRNYQIDMHSLANSALFNFPNNLSFSINFEMIYKQNQTGIEKSNQYNAEATLDYRIKEKGSLSVKMQYVNILYNGTNDNSLGYEMLGGLSIGNNYLWNVAYQTKLFDYLQINLQYEGRLTQDNTVIHVGFLQLKAYF